MEIKAMLNKQKTETLPSEIVELLDIPKNWTEWTSSDGAQFLALVDGTHPALVAYAKKHGYECVSRKFIHPPKENAS